MRRVTRASPASGSSEAPLVLSGDEDGVAPPPRIPPAEKERLRQMQQACTLSMYDHAVAYFKGVLSPPRCLFSLIDTGVSHGLNGGALPNASTRRRFHPTHVS